jgi:hypothetical protein
METVFRRAAKDCVKVRGLLFLEKLICLYYHLIGRLQLNMRGVSRDAQHPRTGQPDPSLAYRYYHGKEIG